MTRIPTITDALADGMPTPDAVRDALRPPERLTVSEWCDRYRVLDSRDGAEPGPWRTSRVPYLREPMDAFADPGVGSITLVKCSRVGGTEMLNNCLLYSANARPMPSMYVLPTERDVHDEFSGRIARIMRSGAKVDSATVDQIDLETMTIYGACASAPGTLIRKTCGNILFDELDNCETQAGRLGNHLQLVQDRTTTFGYRAKVVSVTTPTVASAAAWQKYQTTDKRRYFVPCPLCGGYQALVFDNLKVTPADERDPDKIERESLAVYVCEHCDGEIPASRQMWMVARGLWVPACQEIEEVLPVDDADAVARAATHGPDRWTPSLAGDPPKTRHRGYWLNSLYSPWRSWPQIMAEWFRVKDDPGRLRVFRNSWLAEPWEETIEPVRIEALRAKIGPTSHPPDMVPDRARILLMGADVQASHLEYVIRAWGPREESWLIREGRVESFDELYRLAFQTGFPYVHDPGDVVICTSLAIDSGFRTDEVYEFAKRPGVVAVKGRDSADFRWKAAPVEHFDKARSRQTSLAIYHVNTSLFKSKAHRLAMNPEDQEHGAWHLHSETSDEYLKQFTAEAQVAERTKKRGGRVRVVWKPRAEGIPNHKLDCEVYALALADMLSVPLMKADAQPPRLAAFRPKPKPDAAPTNQPSPSTPRRRGWVRRERGNE